MATIEQTITIKRPVDKVFAYTTDAKSWPKWIPIYRDVEQISQGQIGIGTTFRWITRDKGVTSKWTGKVTEYETNKKWAMKSTSGGMTFEEHETYDPIEGGTKITGVYDMKVGGFSKLFSPMLVSSWRKQMKKSFNNLKSILEAQA